MRNNYVSNHRDRPLRKAADAENVGLRDRVLHFTWSWFSCTMSTGAIAVLLNSQPYTFKGLVTIGKIFFIVDLVLFVLFCCLIIARFAMHPRALRMSMHHPTESFFFGAFLVSIVLILNCFQQYAVPSTGSWMVKTLEILFWGYSAVAMTVVILQYWVIFARESLSVQDAIPGWILPAYPFLVLGPLAAAIAKSQPPQEAINIWIAGVLFQGLGWTLAFLLYTLYFQRLVTGTLPAESQRPGMYVAVGPASYTAQGIINLALLAPDIIPDDFLGSGSLPVGQIWRAMGVPIGIFIWVVGFWFFAVATVSIVAGARQMHFTLNAWAFIFPNAGLTLGVIAIGNALHSDAIKAVASAMTVVLVVVWIVVAVCCVVAVAKGHVMWPGKDEDGGDVTNIPSRGGSRTDGERTD